LIEATIVEVRLTDNLKYGLQWFFRAGDTTSTLSDTTSGTIASSFPGFSYFLSTTDVQVVLNALTEITDVNVVSSPQLLVLDNESARLQIGDEVPVAVQSSQSTIDPSAPLVTTIEYRDTGVILEVTPRVNAGGLVVLEIIQEVSSISETASSTGNSPIISQRRFESTVAVQGGETIALGGLIQDTRTDSITGIPVLAEIPILGNLFKSTTDRIDRTELLVLLTPRVVRDLQDARDVTTELRERLTGLDVLTGAEPGE
jgi:general secretion pathway protein D